MSFKAAVLIMQASFSTFYTQVEHFFLQTNKQKNFTNIKPRIKSQFPALI